MRESFNKRTPSAGSANDLEAKDELLAACLFHGGRLEELRQLSSANITVCYWQGLGYARQGLLDKAVVTLREVLTQEPEHQQAQQALAALLGQIALKKASEEDWQAAASSLKELRRVHLSNSVRPLQFLEADTSMAEMLVFLLTGHRRDAVGVLEEVLRQNPGNRMVAHSLGLASYYAARVLQEQGQWKEAERLWQRAVAAWVTTLNDDDFWEGWRQQVQQRYQAEIVAQDIASLRKQLEEQLVKLFLEMLESRSQTEMPVECLQVIPSLPGRGYPEEHDEGITEVTHCTLGFRALKGIAHSRPNAFVPIIPKGTPYPLAEPRKEFFPPVDRTISFAVDEAFDEANLVEQGVIEYELPEGVPSGTLVEIGFNYDRNRCIRITICVPGKNIVETLVLSRNRPHQGQFQVSQHGWDESLFQRELKAAATLKELGGLPLSGAANPRLVCGPLMVQLLGLHTEFGRFVSGLGIREDDPVQGVMQFLQRLMGMKVEQLDERLPDLAQKKRLMCYFSQLGAAQALLDLSRPEEALEALSYAACQRCRAAAISRQPSSVSQKRRIIVCAESCQDFNYFNPGYAGLPHKEVSLKKDAVELAIEAHLGLAQSEITAAIMDTQAACAHWRDCITLSKELGSEASEKTQRRIVEMTLGRVDVLHRAKKLDEAITLLEGAEGICDDRFDRELVGRLVEVLNERGVKAGSENPPRWGAAVGDLRRAVALNPHAVSPRVNLGITLSNWAWQQYNQGHEDHTIGLLQESVQCLQEGTTLIPRHPELEGQLRQAESALALAYNNRGARRVNAGNWEGALGDLELALQIDPTNQRTHENLRSIFNSYAVSLANGGQLEQAVQVLERGLRRFPGDEQMTENLAQIRLVMNMLGRRRW